MHSSSKTQCMGSLARVKEMTHRVWTWLCRSLAAQEVAAAAAAAAAVVAAAAEELPLDAVCAVENVAEVS
jgi:hypothetical protein